MKSLLLRLSALVFGLGIVFVLQIEHAQARGAVTAPASPTARAAASDLHAPIVAHIDRFARAMLLARDVYTRYVVSFVSNTTQAQWSRAELTTANIDRLVFSAYAGLEKTNDVWSTTLAQHINIGMRNVRTYTSLVAKDTVAEVSENVRMLGHVGREVSAQVLSVLDESGAVVDRVVSGVLTDMRSVYAGVRAVPLITTTQTVAAEHYELHEAFAFESPVRLSGTDTGTLTHSISLTLSTSFDAIDRRLQMFIVADVLSSAGRVRGLALLLREDVHATVIYIADAWRHSGDLLGTSGRYVAQSIDKGVDNYIAIFDQTIFYTYSVGEQIVLAALDAPLGIEFSSNGSYVQESLGLPKTLSNTAVARAEMSTGRVLGQSTEVSWWQKVWQWFAGNAESNVTTVVYGDEGRAIRESQMNNVLSESAIERAVATVIDQYILQGRLSSTRGQKGDTGATGPQGPQGERGAAGSGGRSGGSSSSSSFSGTIDLTSEVTGLLSVVNGGTGLSTVDASALLLGNGAGAMTPLSVGSDGDCLVVSGGVPTWSTCAGGLVDLTSEVVGILPVASGGTGAGTPSGARANLGLGSVATYDVGSGAGDVVVLNGSGKIDTSLLPSITTNATFVVASEVAMLATGAEVGDVAVRTDESKTYILVATPASSLGNWQELLTPTSPVQSVAGKTGTVTLDTADIMSGTFDDARLSNNVIRADGTISFTAAPTWAGTPSNGDELVNKDYADALAQGLLYKEAVRVVADTNVTLSGLQTIDAVTLLEGDRVLVKHQNTGSQNGIYVASSGSWTRATDADTSAEVLAGTAVFATEGSENADTAWVLATNNPITLGSTSLTFVRFASAGVAAAVNAGNGLTKSGNTLNVVGATDRIQVNADNIDISANYIGQNTITTLGTITTGTWQGTTLAVNKGGTNLTSYTAGDLLYASGTTTIAKLAVGSNGQCLLVSSGAPAWGSCGGGMSIGGSITSATQGSVLFAGASGVLAQDNANFFWNDSTDRLGIGTSSPTAPLHIVGASDPEIYLSNDSTVRLRLGLTTATDHIALGSISGSVLLTNETGAIHLATGTSTPSTVRLTVATTGNVGIGDTTPDALFTVGSTSQFQVNSSGAIAAATGVTSSGTITFSGLSTAGLVINNSSGVLATDTALDVATGGTNLTSYTAGDLLYASGTTTIAKLAVGSNGQCLLVSSGAPAWGSCGGGSSQWTTAGSDIYYNTGNVGVGTAAPSVKLHVYDTATTTVLRVENTSSGTGGEAALSVYNNAGKYLGFEMFGSNYTGRGNYAWFTTDGSELGFYTVAASPIRFYTNNVSTARMTIDSAGSVGVGTTSPGTKLEVNGTYVAGKGALYVKGVSDHGYISVDTDTATTKEAGYIVAKGGSIKWAMYTPQNSSDLYFHDTTTRVVLQAGGNMNVGGDTTPDALFTVGSTSQFQVNSSGAIAAVVGIASSSNYVQSAGTFSLTSANTTQTTTSSAAVFNLNSLTTGTGIYVASSTLSSGKLIDLQVSGTAGLTNQTGLNIAIAGATSTNAQTTYGAQISNTRTNATSGTNVALYLNASGATTANYGLIVNAGYVGIGTTAPVVPLDVFTSSTGFSAFRRGQSTNDTGATIGLYGGTSGGTLRGYIGIGKTGSGAATVFTSEIADSVGIRAQGALHLGAGGDSISMTLASTNGNVGIGTTAPTGRLTVVTADDSAPSTVTAFDTRHSITGSTSSALALSYSSTNGGYITALAPGVAWKALTIQAIGLNFNPSGGSTAFSINSSGKIAQTPSSLTTNGDIGLQQTVTIAGSTAAQTFYGNKLAITNSQTLAGNTLYGSYTSFTDAGSLANSVTGLFVDSSTVNSSDTTTAAVLQDTSKTIASGNQNVFIFTTDSTAADLGGSLGLGGVYTGTSQVPFAALYGRKDNATAGQTGGYFAVSTRPNGSSMAERLRVSSTGNVAIGTTSATDLLTISNTASAPGTSTGAMLHLVSNTANNAAVRFDQAGQVEYSIGVDANSSSGNLRIVNTNGNLGVSSSSAGLILNASGTVGVGTANLTVYDQVATARPLVVGASDTSTTVGGSNAALTITNSSATTSNTASLNFAAITGASTINYSSAQIVGIFGARTNGQYPTGQLAFLTTTSLNAAPSEKMRLDNNGNLGIGDTTPDNKLDVEGDSASNYIASFFNDGNNANRYGVQIQGGADDGSGTTYYINALDGDGTQIGYIARSGGTFALTDVSDRRTKTNIQSTEVDAMEVLTGLRVVDFNRLSDPDGAVITGFIAQEVQKVYPQIVTKGQNGYLGITKENLIPILVKGFQQQQANIGTLQSQLNALQGNPEGNLPASAPLVIRSHLYLSVDSVGGAKILEGATSVRVTFSKSYQYQPIVTVTPSSRVGSEYWVADKDATGFTIYIDEESDRDITFDWHAFASDGAQLTVSDGSTKDITLVLPDEENEEVPDLAPNKQAPAGEERDTLAGESPISGDTNSEPSVVENPVVVPSVSDEQPGTQNQPTADNSTGSSEPL